MPNVKSYGISILSTGQSFLKGEKMKAISVALFAGIMGYAAVQPVSAAEKVVYSFAGGTDGQNLYARLINVNGTLYGTTVSGGTGSCNLQVPGCGTVFAINRKTGAEKVLHLFCSQQNCTDGQSPVAGLIDVNGTLYGTTAGGGTNCTNFGGCGTVFSLDPSTGTETVLHSFGSGTDGSGPAADLIDVKGTLYGTTVGGGTSGLGTVFALDLATGAETVLHSFGSGTDGVQPRAGLINVKGTLYGTTNYGGGTAYDGTVFALDPKTGAETVLYSFCSQANCTDGELPLGRLIDVNGTLYGTTAHGGSTGPCGGGCGTVFSLNPQTSVETVLYSFCSQQSCADGTGPQAGLINVNGMLYGTGAGGGNADSGVVFALNPATSAETVLYSFCSQQNCTDGLDPAAELINVKGKLYGTTVYGGTGSCQPPFPGCGTVFAVKP